MIDKLNPNEKLKSKPLLCEVAVVTPSLLDYRIWLKENEKPNEKYTLVQRIHNVRGRIFDRVEKLYNYYEIQDIDDVLDYLETHLRSN